MANEEMEYSIKFLLSRLPEDELKQHDNGMLSGREPIAGDAKPDSDESKPGWLGLGAKGRNVVRVVNSGARGARLNVIAIDAALRGHHRESFIRGTVSGGKLDPAQFPHAGRLR